MDMADPWVPCIICARILILQQFHHLQFVVLFIAPHLTYPVLYLLCCISYGSWNDDVKLVSLRTGDCRFLIIRVAIRVEAVCSKCSHIPRHQRGSRPFDKRRFGCPETLNVSLRSSRDVAEAPAPFVHLCGPGPII